MLRNTLWTWGTYWEPNVNPLGTWETYWKPDVTHWELEGNIVGTHWELGKIGKKIPSPQNLKWKKKQGTLNACLGLPIGSMKFLFSKEFITIFGLGYYALQRTPYLCGVDNPLCTPNTTWKKLSPLPPTRKQGWPSSLHDTTSHWLHGNYIPKIGFHYFLTWTNT